MLTDPGSDNLKKITELWQKQWIRNAVFFLLLAAVFFLDIPRWINIQVTTLRLSKPQVEASPTFAAHNVYRFNYIIEEPLGAEVQLSSFKGKPLFINFWASWCVPCLAEFSSMEQLAASLPEAEFIFITAEERPAFEKYLSRTNHKFHFYRQATPTPPDFAHGAIPASFLLNEEGVIVFKHIGAADWSALETAKTLRERLDIPSE